MSSFPDYTFLHNGQTVHCYGQMSETQNTYVLSTGGDDAFPIEDLFPFGFVSWPEAEGFLIQWADGHGVQLDEVDAV